MTLSNQLSSGLFESCSTPSQGERRPETIDFDQNISVRAVKALHKINQYLAYTTGEIGPMEFYDDEMNVLYEWNAPNKYGE